VVPVCLFKVVGWLPYISIFCWYLLTYHCHRFEQPESFFQQWLTDGSKSPIRCLHYPAAPVEVANAGTAGGHAGMVAIEYKRRNTMHICLLHLKQDASKITLTMIAFDV